MLHKVQAEARNYRGGSEMHEKVTHYDIVCENSIDEIIAEKLAEKIEMSDKLLGSLASQLKTQE
jgi:SNF2 family DNA or RNA helicase